MFDICRLYLQQDDLLCRYGGEEFIALLPDTDTDEAYRVAERIRVAIAPEQAAQIVLDGLADFDVDAAPELTVSIGIAALSAETESLEQLIAQGDAAMYRAKAWT